MLSAQLSSLIVESAHAADAVDPAASLTGGPYGWIGGLLVFAVTAFVFVRNALGTLKAPPPTSETNVYMGGPLEHALKSLDSIAASVAEIPGTERRVIEMRDAFATAVETTRRNFYQHVDDLHHELEPRIRALEQDVAVLKAGRRR